MQAHFQFGAGSFPPDCRGCDCGESLVAAQVSGDGVLHCGIQFQEVSSFLVVLYSAMLFVERKRVSKLQVVQGRGYFSQLASTQSSSDFMPTGVLQKSFNQIHVSEHHSSAAVPMKTQLIQSGTSEMTLPKPNLTQRPCFRSPNSSSTPPTYCRRPSPSNGRNERTHLSTSKAANRNDHSSK